MSLKFPTIFFGAEWVGKPAIDKAEKAVSGLDKTVNKLAKAFAGVFAAQKIAAFGKSSVQAFAQDQKSAALLSQTLKNLGLQFANPEIEAFIQKTEKLSGTLDDQLRPAMQKLLQTTGSVQGSQKLLSLALDVSKGSGVDLLTVASDLSNAYVGNNKGLKKYNIGLSKAELATMSFAQTSERFAKVFGGQTAAAMDTVQGKFDALTVSADNAKEVIGKGIVDALTTLGGDTNIKSVTDQMDALAQSVSDVVTGLADIVNGLKSIPGAGVLKNILAFSLKYGLVNQIAEVGKYNRTQAKPFSQGMSVSGQTDLYAQNHAKQTKAEKDAARRAKELAALQLKQTKALKDQAALKKAGSVFDMQQIELVAALKGKLSDEDRKRAELQLALLNDNVDLASKLSKEILMAQDSTGNLYKYFTSIPDAKNPFAYLDTWITDFQKKMDALKFPTPTSTYTPAGLDPALAQIGVVAGYGDFASSVTNQASSDLLNGKYGMQSGGGDVNINIVNNGSVIHENQLIDQIQAGTQLSSLSGSPSQIGRIAGMFG